MARGPRDPKEIFHGIIADYKEIFGDDLVGIVLYGSATGQEYRPGKSDINFMVFLSEDGIERLDLAFTVVRKWRKQNVAIPLFLTESYVNESLDVFPVEYLNFQKNHVPVFGKNILSNLTFDTECIRLQCEREIKGKLLLLREAYLESAGKGRALNKIVSHSIGAFIAVFEALLYLRGKDIPKEKRKVIRDAALEFGMNTTILEEVLDVKEDKAGTGSTEPGILFKQYLKEIRKLSKLVDALGG